MEVERARLHFVVGLELFTLAWIPQTPSCRGACAYAVLPRHRLALVLLRRQQRFKFLVDTGQAHIAAHLIHSQRRVLASAAASAIGCLL
ncbi:hypothetical protein D3C77_715460 [compost metagenome]